MKRCPICGNEKFYVTAHVTQDWLVDNNGDYVKTESECVEVIHKPNDEDVWVCANCGWDAMGKEFNIKEED